MSRKDQTASEASRKRRRAAGSAGSSFYVTRGLPFVGMSEYRERRRDPEARIAVKLANEIKRLADGYPRFRLFLNQLQHRVLIQVRSPEWKAKTVLKSLEYREASSLRDIGKSTHLDHVNVITTIAQLEASGQVVRCNRAGGPVKNPDAISYWCRNK